MKRIHALVLAAGGGQRMQADCPKQYLLLNKRPLLWYTLNTLSAVAAIDAIALILAPEDLWFDRFDWDLPKLTIYRIGGAYRTQSVYNGLTALSCAADDWVLVHDAARCCISAALVEQLIHTLQDHPVGGILAVPVSDTLKRAISDKQIDHTIARDPLWLAQTPQMFRAGLLGRALQHSPPESITDEASAIEALGLQPQLVTGSNQNFKVTYPSDLGLAQAILSARGEI